MQYLPDSKWMKQADLFTIEKRDVPSLTLMERAAAQCLAFLKEKKVELSSVCIVCGTGNNGGDGFAIGRMLLAEGIRLQVVLVGERNRCTQETLYQIEKFEQNGGVVLSGYQKIREKEEITLMVDALFGVGLSRDIQGQCADILADMNVSNGFKLAVDIPSGICAASGCILGTAFLADATVTFQAAKAGLELYPGKTYAGQLTVADIGVDLSVFRDMPGIVRLCDEEEYAGILPKRKEDSHKGNYGKLLLIAGSKGMAGAACLCAKAAYKAGAGLIQVYTVEENRNILQIMLPEAIVKTYTTFHEEEVIALMEWADMVCIGPGLSTDETAVNLLGTVAAYSKVPCVVDGDGLNLLSQRPQYLERLSANPLILTPHMKEMERLMHTSIPVLKKERVTLVQKFAQQHKAACVLKDSRTLIALEDGTVYLNPTGNAAMAKAGSGDVLAGVIAGLAVQGMPCCKAALLGVYLHGRAGDLARDAKGSLSVLATDLTEYLSEAVKEKERCKDERI